MNNFFAEEKYTVSVLTDDFRNELFEQNYAFFKKTDPIIFKKIENHVPQRFKLAYIDGVEKFNIYDSENDSLLYPLQQLKNEKIELDAYIEHMPLFTALMKEYFPHKQEDWHLQKSPLLMRLLSQLYDAGPMKQYYPTDSTKKVLASKEFALDSYPYVRVYGIGLGYHLIKLLSRKNVTVLLVYEPEIDFFYLSLFVVPWVKVYEYFDLSQPKRLIMVIGLTGQEARQQILKMGLSMSMILEHAFRRFVLFPNHHDIQHVLEYERADAQILCSNYGMGWYDDAKDGLFNALRNVKLKPKIFQGDQYGPKNLGFTAFVVGAGPSLDQAIPFIKQHQDRVLIFSSGTAIKALAAQGIIPDFHVEQERDMPTVHALETVDPGILNKARLLALSVVQPGVLSLFQQRYLFLKLREPGSALFPPKYPKMHNVNPTVTNASTAMAAALGATTIYLFGVDYAFSSSGEHHAKNTIYDSGGSWSTVNDRIKEDPRQEIRGNLSDVVETQAIWLWSHNVTEGTVKKYPNIKWYNVGDGAFIEGAVPLDYGQLEEYFKINFAFEKQETISQIETLFTALPNTHDLVLKFRKRYLRERLEFISIIQDVLQLPVHSQEEMLSKLLHINEMALSGINALYHVSSLVFSGSIISFVKNAYIQLNYLTTKDDIVKFDADFCAIFSSHLTDLEQDLTASIDHEIGIKQAPH